MTEAFILLDRDGTLIRHIHHLTDPGLVELLPAAVQGLQLLSSQGFHFGIITNQSVIGRGLATRERVAEVNNRVMSLLQEHEISLDFVLVCPHLPEDACLCRKPSPDLGNQAVHEHNIDLKVSYVIGDQESDVFFGHALGVASILVSSDTRVVTDANYRAEDLLDAANWITRQREHR